MQKADYKVSKNKNGIVKREKLTKHWTDWVDYWAVDFDYMQRKETIKVAVGSGLGGIAPLPGFEPPQGEMALPKFEERWTGSYIFENEWQSFRTRQNRELELETETGEIILGRAERKELVKYWSRDFGNRKRESPTPGRVRSPVACPHRKFHNRPHR